MASFFVIRGPDKGKNIQLDEHARTVFRIGREENNEVVLIDSEVSRAHAELKCKGGRFQLVDCNSSNGTFLNGQRITDCSLNNGDRIQLGSTVILFRDVTPGDSINRRHDVDLVVDIEQDDVSNIAQRVSAPATQDLQDSSLSDDSLGSGILSSGRLGEATNQWEIMYLTSRAISHTTDIGQLLNQIIELIFEWIDCDRGCIMLSDAATGELQPSCRKDRNTSVDADRMLISSTILDYVMVRSEGVRTTDARDDERFENAASVVTRGIREAICVPLQGRYSTVGAIYIDTYQAQSHVPGLTEKPPSRLNDEHLKLMIAIGHQAAVAIEDSMHYQGMLQAERMAIMGQTISRVSHHIKNVLQGIRMGSYIVNDGLEKQNLDVVQKGWGTVMRNTDRISELVMDMLTYSKERELHLQPSDIISALRDGVEAMQLYATDKNTKLTLDTGLLSNKTVWMDSNAIDRALANLLSNAIEAASSADRSVRENTDDPKVSVRLDIAPDEQTVSISVRDNGDGISEEHCESVFNMFTSSKGSAGTGLGLPISRKILEEHDGQLTVKSRVGSYAVFTMKWPIEPKQKPSHQKAGNVNLHGEGRETQKEF